MQNTLNIENTEINVSIYFILFYLFINQSISKNTVYKITQFKKIKQMCGLNGQNRAVPLTCSQKHYFITFSFYNVTRNNSQITYILVAQK